MNQAPPNRSASTTTAAWKQRYEVLRQLAVAGSQILEADPLGLVLLLRQGVAGWMRSWSRLAQTPPAQRMPTPVILPRSQWQQQLTGLLAEMSLAHLPQRAAL